MILFISPSGITGHLVFDSFITPSISMNLQQHSAFFKANDIKDLILDLRYNTGGYLNIAQTLASYIAGDVQYRDRYLPNFSIMTKHQDANNYHSYLKLLPIHLD